MSSVDATRPCKEAPQTYETHHDFDGGPSPSEIVIDAIATAEGVDPTDYPLELYETVDLEALDALFDQHSPGDHWHFEFSVEGYLVVVSGEGTVTVYEN